MKPEPPCLRLTLVCAAAAERENESRRQFISQASQALQAARAGAMPAAQAAAGPARSATAGRG
jgi:hypothetical protein